MTADAMDGVTADAMDGATGGATAGVTNVVDAELRTSAPPAVAALAAQLAARARGGAAAVLYYGSTLRDGALDGVLDFYVLVDDLRDWPGPRLAAWAGRVLPPNVGWVESGGLRAKVAVMTPAQFGHAMAPARIDTTLWARFSQPALCVHARGAAERSAVRDAVAQAVRTAAGWAAALGPVRGDAAAYWRALYARTYAAELRVERTSRGADLLAGREARYAALLPAAWREQGIAFDDDGSGVLTPRVSGAVRAAAERRWALRRACGKAMNLLRLLKAAATFDNAIDYVAWKVERHSGHRLVPTDFQRRHPLLAAPALYLRLRRAGVLR